MLQPMTANEISNADMKLLSDGKGNSRAGKAAMNQFVADSSVHARAPIVRIATFNSQSLRAEELPGAAASGGTLSRPDFPGLA